MFAKILIDISVKDVDQLYDYIITKEQLNNIEVGMRVYVPFGNMKRLGFVMKISNETAYPKDKIKKIIEVLDVFPSLNKEQLLYFNYLDSINYSLSIDIIKTILPKELFLSYYQSIKIKNKSIRLPDNLLKLFGNNEEIKIDKNLLKYKKEISLLIDQGDLEIIKKYNQRGSSQYIDAIYYNDNHNYARVNNYVDLINYVKNNSGQIKSEISNKGFSISSINTLIKNNVFKVEKEIKIRTSSFIKTDDVKKHVLNKEQEIAFEEITKNINNNKVFLLNGITGSGKTEVYMHVISAVLKNNKNILYLVPEITMVAPTVKYLRSRFNVAITHYNSSLSAGERFDSWYQITNNEAKLIVGTRSSAFLPIQNLGIIIVDEEHDNSYYQVGDVNYNLIDILLLKKEYHKIPLLLGSATPSVETMFLAKNNSFKLLTLNERATSQPLPKTYFVDMKEELKLGNTSIFSNLLKEKIRDRITKKEQVVILYNRRGYSQFVLCRNCGYVPKCENCDISLTYYKDDNILKCTKCNYQEQASSNCPVCNSSKINTIGMGIDQVHERLQLEFPNAKILKLDSDSTKKKGSHEQIWLSFYNEEADILLGTQMISKGLDFPNVTLSAILMADLELKVPSYLASENTYNLLTQLVGRSGRSLKGEAVIQGYDLNHFAINSVNKPYIEFYKKALTQREIANYPPFYKNLQIVISNESYLKAFQDALKIKKDILKHYELVLGPTEPQIKYIKNQYRFVLTIKTKLNEYDKIFNIIENHQLENVEFYNFLEVL